MALITVASTEQNVAKSTTALHLAQGIAITGLRTLLVDFTPNGTVSAWLDCKRGAGEPSSSAFVDAQGDLTKIPETVIVEDVRENLDIIPSGPELQSKAWKLMVRDREFMMLSAFHQLGTTYDCIVVDTSPSSNLLTRNALVASDILLYPSLERESSISGIESFLGLSSYFELNPVFYILPIMRPEVIAQPLDGYLMPVMERHHAQVRNQLASDDLDNLEADVRLSENGIHESNAIEALQSAKMSAFDAEEKSTKALKRFSKNIHQLAHDYMMLVEEVSQLIVPKTSSAIEEETVSVNRKRA